AEGGTGRLAAAFRPQGRTGVPLPGAEAEARVPRPRRGRAAWFDRPHRHPPRPDRGAGGLRPARDRDRLAHVVPRAKPAGPDAAVVLLTHASRAEVADTDPDVMAGMLTAIMNFARVSFAEGSDELRRLELGKKTVVIERSPRFILAVAVAGLAPAEMREEMRAFLERAERRYGPLMSSWSGDVSAVAGLQAMTSR